MADSPEEIRILAAGRAGPQSIITPSSGEAIMVPTKPITLKAGTPVKSVLEFSWK